MKPALPVQTGEQNVHLKADRLLPVSTTAAAFVPEPSYIPSCRRVTFLHAVLVALPLLPSVDVSDSFSLVEAEKTHPAQSNMSQCILVMPLSSQHSLLSHCAHS